MKKNILGRRECPLKLAGNDVLRVPMSIERLNDNVEMLTIQVVPGDEGGRIEVSWEKTKAVAGFRTAR